MKKIFITCALLPIVLLTAFGQMKMPDSASTGEEKELIVRTVEDNELIVRIAHAAPLTGFQAHMGRDNEKGVRMAIDELNASNFFIGGKKARFELLSEDDQAERSVAAMVAQKFVTEKVNGVIGHLNSGATIQSSKIYADAGLPQISPSATNPKYTQQGYKTAFRVMSNDAQQGSVLGTVAVNDLRARKIAIIDDRTAYGQGLADEFEKAAVAAGATIVRREFTTDKATDFTAILTKIKRLKPDLLFYGGLDSEAGPMVRRMQTLGFKVQFLGGDGIFSSNFIRLGNTAAEGAIASIAGVPLEKMPGGARFHERFTSQYGQIQLYAPYCYDAVMVMALAMQRAASSEPAAYAPELAKTDYSGVTSRIRFDDKGDLLDASFTLYQVKNGEWQILKIVQ